MAVGGVQIGALPSRIGIMRRKNSLISSPRFAQTAATRNSYSKAHGGGQEPPP